MKAIRISAYEKGKVGLEEVELHPMQPHELRIRAEKSILSPGTERAFTLALPTTPDKFPQALGYSCAGIVEQVGEAVTGFCPGDRVAGSMNHQNICHFPADKAFHIPEGVSMEDAAFVHVGNIAMQGVRHARIELGESVVVIGCGLIGQLALQMAAISGAYPVIAVDKVASKRQVALKCGADAAVDANAPDWLEQVRRLAGGEGAAVVIEATGFAGPVSDALQAARPFGRVVLLASTRAFEVPVRAYQDIHKKGLSVIGAHVALNPAAESRPGFWSWADNSTALLRMLKAGRFQFQPLITHRACWKDHAAIYQKVLAWDADFITCAFDWSDKE